MVRCHPENGNTFSNTSIYVPRSISSTRSVILTATFGNHGIGVWEFSSSIRGFRHFGSRTARRIPIMVSDRRSRQLRLTLNKSHHKSSSSHIIYREQLPKTHLVHGN